jgi:PAS domain-containing protein
MPNDDQPNSGIETLRATEDSVIHLRRRAAEFRAIFERATIGIALVDDQRRPMRCNPALQRLLGYTEEELCRMTFPNSRIRMTCVRT